jgi:hypothetical protein
MDASFVVGALASAVAISAWQGVAAWRRHRRERSTAAPVGSNVPDRVVRRVRISPTVAADIFERAGGSFGYHLLDADGDGERWIGSARGSPASAYDTADRAEAHARRAAARG